jgi:hypothetical protein
MCSYCKRVRNDQNYWDQIEGYLSKHSDLQSSHGVCDECFNKHAASFGISEAGVAILVPRKLNVLP